MSKKIKNETDLLAAKIHYKFDKRAKSDEQKAVINFFAAEYGLAGGCLGKKAMSTEEYIAKVGERCNSLDLRSRAIEKIGIDESEISEISPICLHAFMFNDTIRDYYTREDPVNHQVVTSRYQITWVFFSATQIYIYSYQFDMTSDDVWETTYEFFYQDITCFATESDLKERIRERQGCLDGGCSPKGCVNEVKGCLKGDRYYKTYYTVDTLKITVPGHEHSICMRNAGDQAACIQGAKAMLRERKFIK